MKMQSVDELIGEYAVIEAAAQDVLSDKQQVCCRYSLSGNMNLAPRDLLDLFSPIPLGPVLIDCGAGW